MKRLFLVFVTVLISSPLFSQGFRNMEPDEMAKRDTEQLAEKLDLTEDQEKLTYEISFKNATKMKEVFNTSAGDRETMRNKMQQIRHERDSSFQEILTDWQFEAYKKFQQERIEQRQQRQGGGRPQQ